MDVLLYAVDKSCYGIYILYVVIISIVREKLYVGATVFFKMNGNLVLRNCKYTA